MGYQYQQQRPFKPEINYDQLLWQALVNIVNSPMMPEFEASNIGGGTSFAFSSSHVSEERVAICVGLGYEMVKEEGEKDSLFQKELKEAEQMPEGIERSLKTWGAIIRMQKRKGFFEKHVKIASLGT